MTEAYEYADGLGRKPHELQLADFLDHFGHTAVLGVRQLSAGELYRMNVAKNVYNAKKSRSKAEDWTKWTRENPKAAELLVEVERIIDDG